MKLLILFVPVFILVFISFELGRQEGSKEYAWSVAKEVELVQAKINREDLSNIVSEVKELRNLRDKVDLFLEEHKKARKYFE